MKRHINIPIFIPHLGCPNTCVFCNQRTISGVSCFDPAKVDEDIKKALTTVTGDDEVEIAFFGGSFTGIDRNLMISLLDIAHKYVEMGLVSSIRCSTRPDYIDRDVLSVLKRYSVKVIELGLQSTDDAVLLKTKRGHNFDAEKRACELIVSEGFELVGQMMIGLPASTPQSELATAEFIISCGAKAARIYPTVVFKGTELCDMCHSGDYLPLSIEDAVARSSAVFRKFIDSGVNVIRIGLCSSENLASDDTYYGGPNHPALGELVESKLYLEIISERMEEYSPKNGEIPTVLVPPGATSKAIGHKRKNKAELISKFSLKDIKFKEDATIRAYDAKIRREER